MTFFSGTDTQELLDGGTDTNHFVSLIVNNAGKYTAGITRKVKVVRDVEEAITYPTWNAEERETTDSYQEELEYMQWFQLNVEVETDVDAFEEEMLGRIKEIKESKVKETPKTETPAYPKYQGYYSSYVPQASFTPNKQMELPFEKSVPSTSYIESDIPYGTGVINKDIIDTVVKQLVTLSIVIPKESKIDVMKWINSMEKLFDDRFSDMQDFEAFVTNYVDFLVNYTLDAKTYLKDSKDSDLGNTELSAMLAFDVSMALTELPTNKYIKKIMDLLDDYIL